MIVRPRPGPAARATELVEVITPRTNPAGVLAAERLLTALPGRDRVALSGWPRIR
jgi:hypothetical protein